MDNRELFKKTAQFGFGSFETGPAADANQTLAEMAKSGDLRMWDGFPVVLANSAEKGFFNYEKLQNHFHDPAGRYLLSQLLLLSLGVYRALNLKYSWEEKLLSKFSENEKAKLNEFAEKLRANGELWVAGKAVSGQKLKAVFGNYSVEAAAKRNNLFLLKNEMELEYSLSQVFSPKQKELFFKKLNGEHLTKTENEYFSRTVRKKVAALANPDLHGLARQLLK